MRAPRVRLAAPLRGFLRWMGLTLAVVLGLRTPAPASGGPGEASGALRARVSVDGPGFVRVRGAALKALGFQAAQGVRVTHAGQPVPVLQDSVADDVIFLATRIGARRSYTLHAMAGPSRRAVAAGSVAPAGPPPAGIDAVRDEARAMCWEHLPRVHGPQSAAEAEAYARPGPTWFHARLAPGEHLGLALPAGTVPGVPLRLLVVAQVTQPGPITLSVEHAGTQQEVRGTSGLEVTLERPDPSQPVVLRHATPILPAPRSDVSTGRGTVWIERLLWEGPWDLARADSAVHVALADRPFALRGWPRAGWHALALDLEDGVYGLPRTWPSTLDHLLPGLPPGWSALETEFQPGSESGSLWLGPEREAVPVAAPPQPQGLWTRAGAEHLIVCLPHLRAPCERLAAHRRAQGLSSAVITTHEVDAAKGDGDHDPELLRRFLVQRREDAALPALRYVLLVGDAALDRPDLVQRPTLPTWLGRTQYNGATSADTLCVERNDAPTLDAPVVGRLPLEDAATLDGFVTRLVAYEQAPPADASRRMLRFLASEGRFGLVADMMIEQLFRRIVGRSIPPAYDVEVTFASPASAFLWAPRELNDKVIEGLNEGGLFVTYVGHGFAEGFDDLRVGGERHRILHRSDAPRVAVRGTPPVVIALACNTAEFDAPGVPCLGEALMAQPAGPIAYVGATRICHPAGNAFLGRSLARAMFPRGPAAGAGEVRRLGEVLAAARREVLDPREDDQDELRLLTTGTAALLPPGSTLARLKEEAFLLYALLGDPATRLALPELALEVQARMDGEGLAVEVHGVPAGREVEVQVDVPRLRQNPLRPLQRGLKPSDPAQAAAIRENHARANDKRVLGGRAAVEGGVARLRLLPEPGTMALSDAALGGTLHVRAWLVGPGPAGLGAATLDVPGATPR